MPDHVRRRIEALESRRAHLKDGPKDCRCADHIGLPALRAELEERRRAEAERIGPPPF